MRAVVSLAKREVDSYRIVTNFPVSLLFNGF